VDEPGNMPLLEFVMQQLWEDAARRDGAMRHAAYAQMGGVAGALTKTAEATFEKLSERDQQAARRLFLQLVRTSPTGNDSRRRVPQNEIGSSERNLVKTLADARLVVTTRDAISQEESAEVAHEALIRSWPRLKGWLNENREYLLWRERLRVSIDAWLSLAQDEGALLRGKGLAEAEDRSRERPGILTTQEQAFIAQSVALRQREFQERLQQRRQRYMGVIALFAITLIAVIGWLTREINIYFPDSAIQRAANVIVDEYRFPPLPGEARRRGAEDLESVRVKAVQLVQDGDLALSKDDRSRAYSLYKEALPLKRHLAEAEPGNTRLRKDLLVHYRRLIDVLPTQDPAAAGYLRAAERELSWFETTNAMEGDAEMRDIRDFFRRMSKSAAVRPDERSRP